MERGEAGTLTSY